MYAVDILDADLKFTHLVEEIERSEKLDIIITRNGQPSAMLIPFNFSICSKRIGIAKNLFEIPDNIDADNDKIAHMFGFNSN